MGHFSIYSNILDGQIYKLKKELTWDKVQSIGKGNSFRVFRLGPVFALKLKRGSSNNTGVVVPGRFLCWTLLIFEGVNRL